ncbi:hypothetical protein E6C50_01625 [Flavobacterium supellecticarium]|uniref:Uncharacterized protein n=1 Tax=Flavobacterium supellecticarium TaxID=2565924 RepID=A0A4S4A3T3_9FLAO|nr:hypothetical protein [Flavobacterium supellecticarium]THF52933.1 hypothetical protein E6C50_01625 [Flavobacterium supellecticarium]
MENETYIKHKIKESIVELKSIFLKIHSREDLLKYQKEKNIGYAEIEIIAMLKFDFAWGAKKLYKQICFFLENQRMLEYLHQFKESLELFYVNDHSILKGAKSAHTGEILSLLLIEIEDFLNVFEYYGENEIEYLLKRTGIIYLETILNNSAMIINDLNRNPKTETEVYNVIKIVCKSIFPEANYPTTTFNKIAKEYKPDILIPYLNCAIEYKYAESEQKLKETIDQIFVDVHGYSDNSTYKIFYAVFYVKTDIWGRKKFEKVWQEKGFPKNWIGIYVVG